MTSLTEKGLKATNNIIIIEIVLYFPSMSHTLYLTADIESRPKCMFIVYSGNKDNIHIYQEQYGTKEQKEKARKPIYVTLDTSGALLFF